MRTLYRRSFLRDLEKVRDRKLRRRLASSLETIESAPHLSTVAGVKPLVGHPRYYRVRIGKYRLGLYLDGEVVEVVRFLHRRDVYRYFP